MPKKASEKKPTKKVPKVTKAPATIEASSESTIESLPTPTAETTPTVTLETTQTVTPQTSSSIPTEPTTVTPATVPPAPSTPPTTAGIVTEPDPTMGITTNTLSAASPTIAPITMTDTPITDGVDDFEPEQKGNGMKVVFIFLTAIIVGGGAVAGFMYFSPMKSDTTDTPQVATSPTQVPAIDTEAPIASESADELNLAELSVQILNGSGTSGEASRVRDALQEAGFETFSLGNADSYDYTDTEVQIKEDADAGIFDKVKEALTSYTVVEKAPLETTSDYDIVIVVGKQK